MFEVIKEMYSSNGFEGIPDIKFEEEVNGDTVAARGEQSGVIYIDLEELLGKTPTEVVSILVHESVHSEKITQSSGSKLTEEAFVKSKEEQVKDKYKEEKEGLSEKEQKEQEEYLAELDKENEGLREYSESLNADSFSEEVEGYWGSYIFSPDALNNPFEVNKDDITYKNGKAYYKNQEVDVTYNLTTSGTQNKVTIQAVEGNKIVDLVLGEVEGILGSKILSSLGKGVKSGLVKIGDKTYEIVVENGKPIIKKIVEVTKKGIAKLTGKTTNNVLDKGFSTGKAGEEYLAKSVGGEPQKFFSTGDGARFIDQYVMKNGIAHESKVGYTSLTKSVKRQILKDVELMNQKKIKGSTWHFYKSSVTGKIGASKPLLEFLEQNGIKYEIHK